MSAERLDASAWQLKHDELTAALHEDSDEGLAAWLDAAADAVLACDLATSERLAHDAFPLPADISPLLERYLSPGIAAWRSELTAEAAKLLSAGDPLAESFIRQALTSKERDNVDSAAALPHALKAAWLKAVGRIREAAEAALEAGRRYSWQGQASQQIAIELLTGAIELDPDLVAAYWQLADLWRLRSVSPQPPYVAAEPLGRSLAAWNAGAARRLPDASTSWAYLTRALICEQQARLDDGNRLALWWEAICYLERAILLDDSDVGRWTALARLHRLLENDSCALNVTAEALKRDAKDASALEERATILANTGAFDEAAKVIEQRLVRDAEDTWARGVKAYILAGQKDYGAARDVIEQMNALDPDNIWNLDLLALCSWMVGERAKALVAYERIRTIQTTSTVTTDDLPTCAYAAYKLGKIDDAIAQLETLTGDSQVRGDVRRTLGLCYFVKGRVVRAEELLLSGLARAQVHELEAFQAVDLADLDASLSGWYRVPGAAAAFGRVKKTAAALVSGLSRLAAEDPRTVAVSELSTVVQMLPKDDRSAAKIAAHAGLARLKLDQQRWGEAAEAYRELQGLDPTAPEFEVGIARSLEGLRSEARARAAAGDIAQATNLFRDLINLHTAFSRQDPLSLIYEDFGDTLWRAGDSRALEHFEQALTLLPSAENDARVARLHVRLALALQQQGDATRARTHYIDALERYRVEDSASAGKALADSCRPLIHSVAHYWTIDAAWATFGSDPTISDSLRCDFEGARLSALKYLDDVFGLSKTADPSVAVPLVTPISLEVGSALVPLVDPKSDGGKFIFEDIPAMRNGIESSTGVRVPGIDVRGSASGPDRYVIQLDETPRADGVVRVGSKYSTVSSADLVAAGVVGESMIENVNTVLGRPGEWCSPAQGDALARGGFQVLSETQFMLTHVDQILRQHLDSFLGVQELRLLLVELKKKDPVTASHTSALNDRRFFVMFARVLRALVREQVPIVEWARILDTVQRLGFHRVDEIVSQVRLTLRDRLPGNQEIVEYVEVPPDWQGRIHGDPGVFNVSPFDAHGMLVVIRGLLGKRSKPVALVTPTTSLRTFVRRLIEFEFPAVAVLWRDEVLHPERLAVEGRASADGIPRPSVAGLNP